MKSKNSYLTKTSRPLYPEIFPITRLYKLIDQSFKKPVTWISGPPGSGKSTLVSSYIEKRAIPSLWYRMDSGDSDIATFFHYLKSAAKSESLFNKLSECLPENVSDISFFSRTFFEKLFKGLKKPFLLVFDNYHEVPSDDPFHEMIRNGLEAAPPEIHLIFISRNEPPQALSRLVMHQNIEQINGEDLRLTKDEILGMMRVKVKRKTERKEAEWIDQKVNGWAAGVVLFLEELKKGKQDNLEARCFETICEYFNAEVFKDLAPEFKTLLMKCAVLPEVTPIMAEKLTGIKEAGKILELLYRKNCFIEKIALAKSDPLFRLHSIFRDYLLLKGKDIFQKNEGRELRKKAAEILLDAGRAEEGFSLFHEISDWEGVIRLVRKIADVVLLEGKARVLESWISALPEEIIMSAPWMQYYLGICSLPFEPLQSRKSLEKAYHLFNERKDLQGAALACSYVIHSIVLHSEDMTSLREWTHHAKNLLSAGIPQLSPEFHESLTGSLYAGLSLLGENDPEFLSWEEKVLQIARSNHDKNIKLSIYSSYVLNQIQKGNFGGARQILDSMSHLTQSCDQLFLMNKIRFKWVEAVFYHMNAETEKSIQIIQETLNIAHHHGIHFMDNQLMGQAVQSSLNQGDFKRAAIFFNKIESHFENISLHDQGTYYQLKSYFAYLQEDLNSTVQYADLMMKISKEGEENPLGVFRTHLLFALIRIKSGDLEKATQHLKKCCKAMDLEENALCHFEYLLAESLHCLESKLYQAGLTTLRKGFNLGREKGFVNSSFWDPKSMARLCVAALEEGIETEYVQNLISRRGLFPDKPPLEIEEWPWPIKIYTLGRFSILKDGQPLQFSKKAPQAPLALLKTIISLGGREISEDQITEILWPEADGDSARNTLSVTLCRLRKLLDNDNSVSLINGRLTLNLNCCHIDVCVFERLLGKAETLLKKGNREESIRLIERAGSIYHGPFMANELESSISIFREKLKSKYLRFMGELGRIYEEQKEFRKAVDTFKKGIESEPLAEEFYQRLMLCYKKNGQVTEALETFHRLKKILSSSLGIEPAPQTESLYKSLTSRNIK